ncbi:hypothetical protein A2U01_0117473, partial [Trifolium medium]|nr:hypothetical protein [Trifolium medium]
MRGVLGASVDRIMDSSVIGLLFAAVIVGNECDGSDYGGGESDNG